MGGVSTSLVRRSEGWGYTSKTLPVGPGMPNNIIDALSYKYSSWY